MIPNNPHSFDLIRGQDAAIQMLQSCLTADRVPHAYLFTGPAGSGKRTAARTWAKVLLCRTPPSPGQACGACGSCAKIDGGLHPDLLWVDFSRQAALLKEPVEKQKSLKISTIRDMEHALRLKPFESPVKVAILAPAETLGDDAAHALLKIVEEPPPGTYIVLIATEAGVLLPTIRSRCQRVRFRPLSAEVVRDLLVRRFGDRPMGDLERAARAADGSVERATRILEEGGGAEFPWAESPVSELLTWCEGFQNPRVGRAGAERFLETLLTRIQEEARAGARSAEDLQPVYQALARLRQNAGVSLTLQHVLLHLRRSARRRGVLA